MTRSMQIFVFALAALVCGSLTGYGLAQPKSPPPDKGAAMSDAGAGARPCPHLSMECPMHALAELAEIKVEKTKTGASVHIVARDQAKLGEVQALAEKMGQHLSSGECSMMKGHGGQGGHGHGKPMMK